MKPGMRQENIVKNLIVDTGQGYILYVLPLSERADLDHLARQLGVKRAALISKDTLEHKLKLQIGAVPAFGSLFNLPVYLDQRVADVKTYGHQCSRSRSSRSVRSGWPITGTGAAGHHRLNGFVYNKRMLKMHPLSCRRRCHRRLH
jgi:hypothetical protein